MKGRLMKSEIKQIGGFQYQVTQVSAGVGLEAAARMANLIGPGFTAAPETGGMNSMTLGAVLGKVLSNPALSSQLAWFVKEFGEKTQVGFPDGKTQTLARIYETHFAGEIADQLDWLRFAFEVNMSSFFVIARNLIGSFWAEAQKGESDSQSPSPAKPSGGSGA